MLSFMLTLVVSLGLAQAPAPSVNVACTVLSAAQVTSMIGAAKTLPMTSAPNGSTCMFQNNDKVITVFVATAPSADAAKRMYDSKKLIASGTEITGWGVPSYGASQKKVAACGVMKQQTLYEVKATDPAQTADAMTQKLQAAMKDFAARK
jgi:hypothetical protein